jgi:hypothetical protein
VTARLPTSLLSAAGLIAGFGVAVGTGSRALGGVVLACFGLTCVYVWLRRDGRGTATRLTATGLFAFAASHVLGLVIGAWPSVLIVAAGTASACWRYSDRASVRFEHPGADETARLGAGRACEDRAADVLDVR